MVFSMISKIEVALRVRLVEALLIHGEPLVLQDSSIFKEKKRYWQNMATVASEIARSNDVFIKHNFDNHDGEVPVWAAVEVLSFGTLSKIIKNYLCSSDKECTVFVNAFDKLIQNNKADQTKHFLLKSVRLSAECYDKHFAIFL